MKDTLQMSHPRKDVCHPYESTAVILNFCRSSKKPTKVLTTRFLPYHSQAIDKVLTAYPVNNPSHLQKYGYDFERQAEKPCIMPLPEDFATDGLGATPCTSKDAENLIGGYLAYLFKSTPVTNAITFVLCGFDGWSLNLYELAKFERDYLVPRQNDTTLYLAVIEKTKLGLNVTTIDFQKYIQPNWKRINELEHVAVFSLREIINAFLHGTTQFHIDHLLGLYLQGLKDRHHAPKSPLYCKGRNNIRSAWEAIEKRRSKAPKRAKVIVKTDVGVTEILDSTEEEVIVISDSSSVADTTAPQKSGLKRSRRAPSPSTDSATDTEEPKTEDVKLKGQTTNILELRKFKEERNEHHIDVDQSPATISDNIPKVRGSL